MDVQPQPSGAGAQPNDRLKITSRILAITAGASLVVGIILGPIVAGHQTLAVDPSASPAEHLLTVSGVGEVVLKPDVADIVIGVWAEKPTAKEARSAAASAMDGVIAAIKKLGVADKDIQTIDVSLQPVYDYGSSSRPRVTGQRFTNTVRVTVRKLDAVPAVVDDSISAGATVVSGITFRVDDPKAAQAQARQMAVDDARSKADALASAGHVSIKGVATITETSYSPPTPVYAQYDAAKSAAGSSTPIQAGTSEVQIQVTVAFLIG